jgi:hypothetical protein
MIPSQQIASAAAQPVPVNRPGERRVSVRYRSGITGSCQTLAVLRESTWEAIVRDISANGIGLLLERRFEPGVLLALELVDRDQQAHLMLARVSHATAQSEGGWLIGCTLLNPLSEEEVQILH